MKEDIIDITEFIKNQQVGIKPISLRDTLILRPYDKEMFHRILKTTDLPYDFDQSSKEWWRWYCEIYGFSYSRVKKSYALWLTMSLKKNLGVYMSFLMKMPGKRLKPINKRKNVEFLYKSSLKVKQINYKDFLNKSFYNMSDCWSPTFHIWSMGAKNILLFMEIDLIEVLEVLVFLIEKLICLSLVIMVDEMIYKIWVAYFIEMYYVCLKIL